MDTHTALVALTALDANLIRARIHKLEAKITSTDTHTGGILNSQTTAGLGKTEKTNECIVTVSLKLVGYPKGTTKENAEKSTPVFSIEVAIVGVYSWPSMPAQSILNDQNLIFGLGRPLYAIAASECQAAAAKIGFHGIKTPSEMPRAGEGDDLPLTKDGIRMIATDAAVASSLSSKLATKKSLKKNPNKIIK